MKNVFKISIIGALIVVGFFAVGHKNASAEVNCIEIKNADGDIVSEVINGIFVEENVYPGWSKSKLFSVTNKCTENASLVLAFSSSDSNSNSDLAKVMQIVISRGSIDVVSGYSLFSIRGTTLSLGEIGPGITNDYILKIAFDSMAGNEYQRKNTSFDLNYQLSEKVAPTTPPILADNGSNKKKKKKKKKKKVSAVVHNFIGIYSSGESAEDAAIVAGAADNNDREETRREKFDSKDEPVVAGVRDEKNEMCQGGWPLWAWLLSLVLGSVGIYLFSKTKKISTKVLWQVVIVGIIAGLWYYFDNCREFKWTPWVDVLGGVGLAGILHRRSKKTIDDNFNK
jgi:hypothetical protein